MNFKKMDFKSRMYLDDIMRLEDIDFNNFLLDEKSYENILTHYISCKIFIGAKQLCIRFNKVDGIIKIYSGTIYIYIYIYIMQFMIELIIYFNYLISAKSDAKYIINHNFSRIRVDSYKKKNTNFS